MSSLTESARAPYLKPGLKALLLLAWPIVISRSTQVVIGLGDSVMVGVLGPDELAATTTGAFNVFAVLMFPSGVAFIISTFASQLFGAGDPTGARRFPFYGLAISAATQVLAVAVIPLLPFILSGLDYTETVRALIIEYMWLRLISCGAAVGIEAFGHYYGGLGNTRLPMIFNVLAMVLDLAGNWMLIGGHWGAPAMGVAGAALSSTISTWIVFLGFLWVFLRQRDGQPLVPPGLSRHEFWRVLRFGVPNGINWFFEFFAFNVFVNVVVVGLGTTALAAFMAVFQVNSVAFMPAFAVASAGSILVGQSIGAGNKDDVPRIVFLTWKAAATWQGAISLLYLAVPSFLLLAFANEEAKALGFLVVGARMLRLSSAWQVFDATGMTIAESLRAAGDTTFAMWTRVVLAWFVFMPASLFFVRVMGGGDLVAMGCVVGYIALIAVAMFLRFRTGAWRRFEVLDAAPAGQSG